MTDQGAQYQKVLQMLEDGPKNLKELGISRETARTMRDLGLCDIDPDRFPDEYVPFNPMVLRLHGDTSQWPGWLKWNV